MEIIICPNCGQKMRIPDRKYIRFKCPNSVCRYELQFRNGKPINKINANYWIPTLAIITAAFGSLYYYLFPIPLLVGIAWLAWWICKPYNKIWVKTISSPLLSTAIGLSLLLFLQVILNYSYQSKSVEIPKWLLQLDDLLIWSRLHLEYISEISIIFYIMLITTLLYLAIKKPSWKPISKFAYFEGWLGKISAILIVITSFTFFAPYTLDRSINEAYHKHYKVIYRKELTQERKLLIADLIREKIENNDTSGYYINLPSLSQDLNSLNIDKNTALNEAEQDVTTIMSYEGEVNEQNADNYSPYKDHQCSDEYIDTEWEKEVEKWKKGESEILIKEKVNRKIPNKRRIFIETKVAEVKKKSLVANEAVEATKEVCAKLIGNLVSPADKILGIYVEEFISKASEFLVEKSRLPRLAEQFFNASWDKGKVNVFARIGGLWGKILIDRATKKEEAIARSKAIEEEKAIKVEKAIEEKRAKEEEKVIKKENSSLIREIRNKIKSLDIKKAPENLVEIKKYLGDNSFEPISDSKLNKKIRKILQDDLLRELIENDFSSTIATRNVELKGILEILTNATSLDKAWQDVKKQSYEICTCKF